MDFYQQALAISVKAKPEFAGVGTLSKIGNVYENLGQYEKALDYYQQDLAINRKYEMVRDEAHDFHRIGQFYLQLGEYEKALDYFQQAHVIFAEKEPESVVVTLNDIGVVYSYLHQYEKALDHQQQAMAKQDWYKFMPKGNILTNIGSDYEDLGQHEKALDYYQKALAIHKEIGDINTEGTTLSKNRPCLQQSWPVRKALDLYQQALAIHRKFGDVMAEGADLNQMGCTFLALGKPDKGEEHLAASIEALEAFRLRIRSEEGRIGFQNTMPDVYGGLAAIRLALGKPESAFDAIER